MKNKSFNFPNALTAFRILLAPIFIFFIFQESLFYYILGLIFFIFASITDFFDGYFARKWKQETSFGKFSDPLADKIVVISCLVAFFLLEEQVKLWMILIIIGRDLLITCFRYIAIYKNSVMQTNFFAKVKTAIQMIVIILLFLSLIIISEETRQSINQIYKQGEIQNLSGLEIALNQFYLFTDFLQNEKFQFQQFSNFISSFLPYLSMFITTIITFLSGLLYLFNNRKIFC